MAAVGRVGIYRGAEAEKVGSNVRVYSSTLLELRYTKEDVAACYQHPLRGQPFS